MGEVGRENRGRGVEWASMALSSRLHSRRRVTLIFTRVSLIDGRRARKMSEVSLTKRKEKCENCTKQVTKPPFGSTSTTWGSCTENICSVYAFSATRSRVRMVPTHIRRRRRKLMDR